MRIPLISALMVVVLSLSASTAQAQEAGPQSAVPAELIAGTVGGAALGAAGAYILASTCRPDQGLGTLICLAAAAMIGYVIGVPIGSTMGVNIAGALSGVRGNFLLSVLGAILGEAIGIGIAEVFGEPSESVGVIMALGVIPFLSSAGATLGYNVGAQMAMETQVAEASPTAGTPRYGFVP